MNLPLWWPSIKLGSVLSFLIPLIAIVIVHPIKEKKKTIKKFILCACILMILYLTVFRVSKIDFGERKINLVPFWSYSHFSEADYRWQIIMNTFLFIPFGCVLPWAMKTSLIKTIIIGCLLSICIEIVQFMFYLGMCEFDDVIHNVLGTMIGYGYWRLLKKLRMIMWGFLSKKKKK